MRPRAEKLVATTVITLACFSQVTWAEGGSDAAAQANNPLANNTAFNLQNYYIGELTDSDDSANQFWFRFAKPFTVGNSDWLLRASLPINSFPVAPSGNTETGIGDLSKRSLIN
jgi:hypothetical protein